MNPAKVDRHRLRTLTDLPNIGPAMEKEAMALRRMQVCISSTGHRISTP